MKKLLFILLTGLCLRQVSAAAEAQYWSSIQVNNKVSDDFALVGEWVNRFSEESDQFVTRSVRLGLAYKVTEKWTYTFLVESRLASPVSSSELRYIHQIARKWDLTGFKIGVRGRFEQREYADSPAIANRLRASLRLDADAYTFIGLTPWISTEYFHTVNTVTTRTAGSYETRYQIGIATPFLKGDLELAYLARQQVRAALGSIERRISDYEIANLTLKFSL